MLVHSTKRENRLIDNMERKRKKRAAALLLAVTLSVGALIGCGDGVKKADHPSVISNEATKSTDGLSGSIVVASNRTDMEDVLPAYAEAFMAEHPDCVITFETIKEYEDVVAARVASGAAPDIYYVVEPMNADTYDDFFLPIDDLPFSAKDILFYENGKGSDGKLYVLPLSVSYCGMIYHKKAFAEAGVEEIPQTVEEFYEVCDKLQAAGITPVGTAFQDVWPMFAWCGWNEVTLTAGDRRGEHKYADQELIYDETMLASMNIVRKLYQKGQLEKDILSANWDQFKQDFAHGKIGMHYSESWLPAQLLELGAEQEDIGMFPFPEAANVKVGAGKQWGISKTTECPELAKAFLTYMLEHPFAAEIPSNVNLEMDDPYVKELLSYGVSAIFPIAGDATFSNLKNEIKLDGQEVFLNYIMEKDDVRAKKIVDEWNGKWAAARKSTDQK